MGTKASRLDRPRQGGKEPHEAEDQDLDPPHGDPSQQGSLWISAYGVDISPKPRTLGKPMKEDENPKGHEHGHGDPSALACGGVGEAVHYPQKSPKDTDEEET